MASTYLQRTPSTTNRRTFTWSLWFKRAGVGSGNESLVGAGTSGTEAGAHLLSDVLEVYNYNAGYSIQLVTTQVFRDPSAWYHLVLAFDTTQATASNRVKIYVNGSQVTSFSTANYGSQNLDTNVNYSSYDMLIGRILNSSSYFSGCLAHVHFCDGTQYAASDFGETDATSGIWKPKTNPSVTYGTNGFFLKFANSGSLGTDSSGNGNNFTVNGTGTQTLDTPSNVFATYNSLIATKSQTFSNGNLSVATSAGNAVGGFSTLGVSKGKWYAEFKITAGSTDRGVIGIADNPSEQDRNDTTIGGSTYSYSYFGETGYKVNNSSGSAYGNTYTLGDIVGVALDLDNNYLYFSKNGTWQNSGDPTSGSSGTGAAFNVTAASSTGTGFYFIGAGDNSGAYAHTIAANFGNGYFGTSAISTPYNDGDGFGKFQYQPPSGYYALCTKNINTYG